MTIKQLFAQFLKNNKATKYYKINLIKRKLTLYTKDDVKTYINPLEISPVDCWIKYTPSEMINNAFQWANTPQGYKYWDKLDKQWREKVKDFVKKH